ncbi:hypothetical protein BpHYR1_049466, partial [Brachionus plicatilis]
YFSFHFKLLVKHSSKYKRKSLVKTEQIYEPKENKYGVNERNKTVTNDFKRVCTPVFFYGKKMFSIIQFLSSLVSIYALDFSSNP